MNIFQRLGLPKDYRVDDKVTMHVKHWKDVPASKKKYPLLGQEKKDGVYCMIYNSANGPYFYSRTGLELTNTQFLLFKSEMLSQQGCIYIAELCNYDCSLEELSGFINPNRKEALTVDQMYKIGKSLLYFHDIITVNDFVNGYSTLNYSERFESLCKYFPSYYIIPIKVINNDEEKDAMLYDIVKNAGGEGIVIKYPYVGGLLVIKVICK